MIQRKTQEKKEERSPLIELAVFLSLRSQRPEVFDKMTSENTKLQ